MDELVATGMDALVIERKKNGCSYGGRHGWSGHRTQQRWMSSLHFIPLYDRTSTAQASRVLNICLTVSARTGAVTKRL